MQENGPPAGPPGEGQSPANRHHPERNGPNGGGPTQDDQEAMLQQATSLDHMIIRSVDTLRGLDLNQRIPAGWNDEPPLLMGPRNQPESLALLKGLIRQGIPPSLRCAVWLSNVITAVHPHQEPDYWHDYRTLAKVRPLDHAYEHLLEQTAAARTNIEYWETIPTPSYGRPHWQDLPPASVTASNPQHEQEAMLESIQDPVVALLQEATANGMLAHRRVLTALDRVLGMDHAPLVPAITAVLLLTMSESYAFCAVREMAHDPTFYLPVTVSEEQAWCLAFGDVLRKLHAQTAEYLEDRGVLDLDQLRPIFRDFFLGILPIHLIMRIMDLYSLEGGKVLFRFGVSLLVLFKLHAAQELLTISNASDWWAAFKEWTMHNRYFDWELVVRKAYGVHGRGFRKHLRFPRRHILQRIIRMEEERIQSLRREQEEEAGGGGGAWEATVYHGPPLGLVPPPTALAGEEQVQAILAQPVAVRLHLAQWMPLTLRLTKMELLYSTSYHGRTLDIFYNRVKYAKHTVLLCEVLGPLGTASSPSPGRVAQEGQDTASSSSRPPVVIGMYASQAWRVSTQVYGDGACFLFRLQPDAQCWKWTPRPTLSSNSTTSTAHRNAVVDSVDLEADDSQNNHINNRTALLEQFMVSTRSYISLGGNPDGSSGLRFNEDWTVAESSPAVGFDNEPLPGVGQGSLFEVGLVEVYGLVRQIDGKSV